MTQQPQTLPAQIKPPLMAGGNVAAIIPQSLEEAFRLASALSASGMAPRGIDKPEQILVAIMAGAELGLAPFQSLQSFAVVNGRPTLWGDGLMAVVRARGVRVKEWIDGEGDAMVAHCLATRPDTGEEIERAFTVGDAKKAGLWGKAGPWQQYPKRMLQMRARALALRDGCADMLRGIQIREEVEDYGHVRDITPTPTGLRARLEAAKPSTAEGFTASQAEDDGPAYDATTGEIQDAEIEPVSEAVDAALEGDDLPEALRDAPEPEAAQDAPAAVSTDILHWADELEGNLLDYAGVDPLREDWVSRKAELAAADPERFRELNAAVAKRAQDIGSGA